MRYLLALLVLAIASPAAAAWTIPNGGGRAALQTPHVRHVQIPAVVRGNAAAQPTPAAFGSAACLQFEDNQTVAEYAYFQFEIPEDWTGGDMTVEIDWVPDSEAMTTTEAVGWVLAYGARAIGEAINGSLTSVPVTVDADIAQYVTTHTPFTLAYNDATNPLVHEDHVFVRVGRVNGGVDTFAGTVCITAFEILYTSDGFPECN